MDQLAHGDDFALWITGDVGGVIAYGRITGAPARGESGDLEYWTNPPGERTYVPVEVDEWLDHLAPRAQLLADSRLAGSSIETQPFAANPHRLTADQWSVIKEGIDAARGDDQGWHLQPGDKIRRVDLHRRYGGSSQNGISSSAQTNNILIFTSASSGNQHGYYDRWNEDGTLHYTGDGQHGDQTMVRGNKALYEHRETGKRLRLFDGARGIVRYLGEWVLDPAQPYHEAQAHESGSSELRTVILFHLVPVNAAIHDHPEVPIGQNYMAPDETVQPAPARPSAADPDLTGRNLSAHRRLQNALAGAAQDRGFHVLSPGVSDPDFDLAWRDAVGHVTVCEVKSLTPANEVRQLRAGLGQILDYHDQLTGRAPDLHPVLWIEGEPADSRWVDLCGRLGVTLAWPGKEDLVFEYLPAPKAPPVSSP
ncbi:hypothetical protein [Streptacidiphilus sp. EB129]|uniref:hypothetical protein n=1 Tax=Streptacidiphilus sp. EB129 TaxID=3156262 RepID=UPI003517C115